MISPGDTCGDCGGALKRLGEDVTEELEYVPGHFVVKRIVRPRMACTCCEAFAQAELPSRPITRGRPGPGLLARVLAAKYCDHLPLYRQSEIYARDKVDLHPIDPDVEVARRRSSFNEARRRTHNAALGHGAIEAPA